MDVANRIRNAIQRVQQFKTDSVLVPGLSDRVRHIRDLQARRFAGHYADLLAAGEAREAANFFLTELYGAADFTQRDAQFARIAGSIEKLFPQRVAEVAAALAELHASTEDLDHAMARESMAWSPWDSGHEAAHYATAWRAVGRRVDRDAQLQAVLGIGRELARLTRTPGLRLMLRMMRGPASAAGLAALQRFLENGFDTFAQLLRRDPNAERFLGTVHAREAGFLELMFEPGSVACETELIRILGQAR